MTHTNLVEQLRELDQWATSGVWGQYSPSHGPWKDHANENSDRSKYDTSHHISAMVKEAPYKIAEFHHANDAAFAEALVNAYRAEQLVPAAALDAAQARIAELETHMNEALWAIAVKLSYCPEDLEDAQEGVVGAGLIADKLRENLFPDEAAMPFSETVKESRRAALQPEHKEGE